MFKTARASFKFGNMSVRWLRATNVNPGDNGQIAQRASQYVLNLGLEPEDAWLLSLLSWIEGMPDAALKKALELGLDRFLNQYEGKIALSAATIIAARGVADGTMEPQTRNLPPAPSRSNATETLSSTNEKASNQKKWTLSRSTRQLTYRPTGRVFEQDQYQRDSAGAIAGFVIRNNDHPWASDIDIELVD